MTDDIHAYQKQKDAEWAESERVPKTLHEAAAYLRRFTYYHPHYEEVVRVLTEAVMQAPDAPVEISDD
jgi:hypothetical protein